MKPRVPGATRRIRIWRLGVPAQLGGSKRFVDEAAQEPSYQLTADFEQALAFVEKSFRESSFIGTESRLSTNSGVVR